jgi:hypothetical protein
LPAIIVQGWKGLPKTNTLSFITLGHEFKKGAEFKIAFLKNSFLYFSPPPPSYFLCSSTSLNFEKTDKNSSVESNHRDLRFLNLSLGESIFFEGKKCQDYTGEDENNSNQIGAGTSYTSPTRCHTC